MMRYILYTTKILKILDKKTKIYLSFQIINLFFLAILETIGLGILAIYVGFLSNKSMILERIPNIIREHLINMPYEKIFFQVSIFIILLFIFKNIVILLSNWFTLKLKQRILSRTSSRIFSKIMNLDYEEFDKISRSLIIYRVSNELSRVTNFIFGYISSFKELVLIFTLLIPVFITNYLISVSSFLFLLIFVSILIYFMKTKLKKAAIKINKHSSLMLQSISDIADNFLPIKLTNKSNFFLYKFTNNLNLYINNKNIRSIISGLPRIVLEIVGVIGFIFFSIYIFEKNLNLEIYIPILAFTALVFARTIPAFSNLNIGINTILFNEDSFNSFFDIGYSINEKETEKKIFFESEKNNLNSKLNLNFSNVFFKYKNNKYYILKNVDVEFNENNLIGITGRSGSGKSTFLKLAMGFLKPTDGLISVNGISNYVNLNKWKSLIGYVPQKIILLNSSIKKNIALGLEDNEIDQVKILNTIENPFINEIIKKDDIEKIVLEDGGNLSGGQIQSIGLARALYSNPKIVIFDEPTNNLDIKAKKIFINQINQIKKNRLIFIVSHDENLLNKCDKVYILKNQSLKEIENNKNLEKII